MLARDSLIVIGGDRQSIRYHGFRKGELHIHDALRPVRYACTVGFFIFARVTLWVLQMPSSLRCLRVFSDSSTTILGVGGDCGWW